MSQAWQDALKEFLKPRSVLVGIGSRLRGDGAFGPVLADRLQGKVHWPVLDVGETPENHIGPVLSFEPESVLLVDAVHFGGSPGRIGFFPPDEVAWEGVSTHAASLRLLAEILRSRGGCFVALLGAEPANTGIGAPLSPEVKHAVDVIAACVEQLASACHEMTA